MTRNALILLGGLWHDFDGFVAAHRPWLESSGWQVEATYDLDRLLDLHGVDLVISDTCFSAHREGMNDTSPEGLTPAQTAALVTWVETGGALLAMHAASVIGTSGEAYARLIGGEFVMHPPQFAFTVFPMVDPHPITAEVAAFCAVDEFYMQRLVAPVDVHMVAVERGQAYPMAWTRAAGQGRVAYIAAGHGSSVWSLAPYQRLFLNAVDWLKSKE